MDQQEFKVRLCIEKFGVYFKKAGHQPLMGRLMAYLMLAEPPQKSFEEISEFLLASKSAVSNVLKLLITFGYVDYVSFAGDRKRYFKLNHECWDTYFESQRKEVEEFMNLTTEVLSLRSDKYPEINKGIRELYLLMETFEEEMSSMIEKWKAKSKQPVKKT
jgi:DNA-binding transcriptional regulator GbsR (MarR family)